MAKILTPEALQAIEERAERATPGPWYTDLGGVFITDLEKIFHQDDDACSVCFKKFEDAKLISHCRTDIPALIASHRELEWLLDSVISDLEYISCEGMDDADFYKEEDIVSGVISMALRAREALTVISKFKSRLP